MGAADELRRRVTVHEPAHPWIIPPAAATNPCQYRRERWGTMTENETETDTVVDPPRPGDLTVNQLAVLHADLHPSRVSKRQQGGRDLSYVEAYDIKAMLIRVWGYAGFSADVLDADIVQVIPGEGKYVTVLAKATVRITIHQTGATYTETAAASQSGSQGIGEVSDFAIKTASSDALKRCAIYLGTSFGLGLYNNGQTRDVVRRVYAPGQDQITQDLVEARQPEGNAARQRLQARLKVHETTQQDPQTRAAAHAAPTEPEPEPEPTPAKPPQSEPARKPPAKKMNAARQALAAAEQSAGVTTQEPGA